MSSARYTPEYKDEAIRQVVECGHPVVEVALTDLSTTKRPMILRIIGLNNVRKSQLK